ncbi:hypothetical protein [Streptomyces sp. JJ38]|uniref:hypothetical protein n=1 Tax=Streptomyces sp. JJ38 TaxID=2738128 RepID=UPI001C566E22|nr:hypothetical protein [Streptomyces sp. JJ38]MBW1596375.1 hypothetical protein [Streptomyces sp. JJ38]
MRRSAIGLLVSVAVLVPTPAVATGPEPSQEPTGPPAWYRDDGFRISPEPGFGPGGTPPSWTWTPEPPEPPSSSPTPSPSPTGPTPEPSGSPSPTASDRSAPAANPAPPRPQAPAHQWVPLPDRPVETFGSYDLYADYADPADTARHSGQAAAEPVIGPVLPVLSLGAGFASVGLGLAFLGLRLRRS